MFTQSNGTWTQQQKLVASNSDGSLQGTSVALSADGSTAMVGGPFETFGGGAAWVFTQSNGSWTEQQELLGSESAGSNQGTAVALPDAGRTPMVGKAVREFLPEEATEIIAEAHRTMRTEAVRDYHSPDDGAAAWIARLARSMRTGRSPHKENAAWRLFQNRALVREFRPADGDKIVWEAANLAHAQATKECQRKGWPVPSWASLGDLPGAAR